jgi:hypothetical protein
MIAMAAAAASCLLVSACNGGGADETTSSSSSAGSASSSSSSAPASSTTADYKDEAVEAARAWIEDDASRFTPKNATPEMVEEQKQVDRVDKKAGIKVAGHDTVVETKVNEGLSNPGSVVIDVCVTTDQRVTQKGENVRTDKEGNLIVPGGRQLATVEMTREVGAKAWLVAGSEVRKTPC